LATQLASKGGTVNVEELPLEPVSSPPVELDEESSRK
jgi:hypothetical protein